MPDTIALIACVKSKRSVASRAGDLYTSPLFRMSRGYVERHADRWFILSAKHGLLSPDVVIEPYEQTLVSARVTTRRQWAAMVAEQMRQAGLLGEGRRFLWLTSAAYQRELRAMLPGHAHVDPLKGLGIGQRLAWLKRATSG